jgi:hypothetical protein
MFVLFGTILTVIGASALGLVLWRDRRARVPSGVWLLPGLIALWGGLVPFMFVLLESGITPETALEPGAGALANALPMAQGALLAAVLLGISTVWLMPRSEEPLTIPRVSTGIVTVGAAAGAGITLYVMRDADWAPIPTLVVGGAFLIVALHAGWMRGISVGTHNQLIALVVSGALVAGSWVFFVTTLGLEARWRAVAAGTLDSPYGEYVINTMLFFTVLLMVPTVIIRFRAPNGPIEVGKRGPTLVWMLVFATLYAVPVVGAYNVYGVPADVMKTKVREFRQAGEHGQRTAARTAPTKSYSFTLLFPVPKPPSQQTIIDNPRSST